MNKTEFIKRYFDFVEAAGLVPGQVRVGAGGVLLLLGLRYVTSDLDLELSPQVYRSLVRRYELETKQFETPVGVGELSVWDDFVDLHSVDDLECGVYIDGVWSATVEATLELKRSLNRDKDQCDIRALEKLLHSKE